MELIKSAPALEVNVDFANINHVNILSAITDPFSIQREAYFIASDVCQNLFLRIMDS